MAKRDSTTQMIDLNQQLLDQNNQIKAITRIAQQTKDTSNNILKDLGQQRGKIQRNIDVSKETNKQLQYSEKVANQMYRKAICIKIWLYIAIIVLFATLIVAIWYRVNKSLGG